MSNNLENDVRIMQRNLAKGLTSQKAIDGALADLPDVSDQGEWFDPEAEDEAEADATEGDAAEATPEA